MALDLSALSKLFGGLAGESATIECITTPGCGAAAQLQSRWADKEHARRSRLQRLFRPGEEE
jgi:hypothetical protein